MVVSAVQVSQLITLAPVLSCTLSCLLGLASRMNIAELQPCKVQSCKVQWCKVQSCKVQLYESQAARWIGIVP